MITRWQGDNDRKYPLPLILVCVLLCGCSPVSSADRQQLFCPTGRELPGNNICNKKHPLPEYGGGCFYVGYFSENSLSWQ